MYCMHMHVSLIPSPPLHGVCTASNDSCGGGLGTRLYMYVQCTYTYSVHVLPYVNTSSCISHISAKRVYE